MLAKAKRALLASSFGGVSEMWMRAKGSVFVKVLSGMGPLIARTNNDYSVLLVRLIARVRDKRVGGDVYI